MVHQLTLRSLNLNMVKFIDISFSIWILLRYSEILYRRPKTKIYCLLVAFILSVFMVVTTPDQSDDSDHSDEQNYDHPNLHMNTARCGSQTKKKQENKTKIMQNIIHHKDNGL
ncbi:hypothetical protein ZOSMA_1458G00010 [Zostera marina]|uniref:Uncharacterized protein n=1 Tax=Zostera marina TaxID=29655 RepID=A0A0K9PXD0_ZOSMR|nr:hypothetical protein ZOSMA_1458G00010 [Zostera marina]